MVANVLLLDGMHTSYIPEEKPLADGGAIDPVRLDSFIKFAREAIAGRKRFVFTHSEIVPPTYASTTECANYLLSHLNSPAKSSPSNISTPDTSSARTSPPNSKHTNLKLLNLEPETKLRPGPMGMTQLSSLDLKGLHIRGYSGATAPDHIDHLHAMPFWFPLLHIK